MQEGDHQVLGTFARSLVDQGQSGSLSLSQGSSGVLYVEGNVVQSAASAVLLDKLGDGRFGARGLQELDLHFTNFEESGLHFLIFYYLGLVAFATCEELKKRHSSLQVWSSDTEMLNVCGFHICIIFYSNYCYMHKYAAKLQKYFDMCKFFRTFAAEF